MNPLLLEDPLNPSYQLGQILNGRWHLKSVIGEGSFAVVFLGKDLESGQKVAVKCLYKTGLSNSQLALQREELNILTRVGQHPYITTLLDHAETKDHLYLVLEHCEIDLFDCIMKQTFAPELALKLFGQLVSAVSTCHLVGIYHRDLKPENVLITSSKNPEIRLSDFGLSTTDPLSTEYGCGSVRYMAPECLGPRKNDAKTPYLSAANDVWSLAIILINMLTGKNPWVEPSTKDKHFRNHLQSSSGVVDTFRTQFNFSDGFCQVLRLVFSSSPQQRPSAADFLAHVLRLPSLFHSVSPVPISKRTTPIHSPLSPSSVTGLAYLGQNVVFGKSHPVLPPTPDSLSDAWKANPFANVGHYRDFSGDLSDASCDPSHDMLFQMEEDEIMI
jgi:serine/threonine protein kinase